MTSDAMANALVARLETASAGSRELSDDVIRFLGWRECDADEDSLMINCWVSPEGIKCEDDDRPNVTVSIDDALSLERGGWTASINTQGHAKFWPPVYPDGLPYQTFDTRWFYQANTPALALCVGLVRGHHAMWAIEKHANALR